MNNRIIAAVVLMLMLTGCMLSTPPAPTPTPQPTATQGITQNEALLPTPPPTANWSPDHRYYAATDGVTLVVGDTEQGRLFAQPSAAHVWNWTVDSRFVIFRYAHPHGNRITTVFDTEAWAVTLQTPGCELLNGAPPLTFEPCGDYPVALSPVGNRLLLENGELIDLGSKERVELPAGQGRIFIGSDGEPLADWSPDGSHLAFVLDDEVTLTLYVADGDGGNPRAVAPLNRKPQHLAWAADGAAVIVTAGADDEIVRHDVVGAATGAVNVAPAGNSAIQTYTNPDLGLSLTYSPAWSLEARDGTELSGGSGRTISLEREGYLLAIMAQSKAEAVGDCGGLLQQTGDSPDNYWQYQADGVALWRPKLESGYTNGMSDGFFTFAGIISPTRLYNEPDANGYVGQFTCTPEINDTVYRLTYRLPVSLEAIQAGQYRADLLAEMDAILQSILWTASASLPAQPEPVEPTQPSFQFDAGPVDAIYGHHQFVYLNVGPVVVILDVSEPTAPRPVGAVELPVETIAAITVNNGLAYVAALEDGLRLVDLSQPAQPVEVGVYHPPLIEGVGPNYTGAGPGPPNHLDYRQGARTVAIQPRGDQIYAYVAALGAGLRVLDVTNPVQPVEVGALAAGQGAIVDVAIVGDRAYLVNPQTGLQIVDISEPAQPKIDGLAPRGWGFALAPGQGASPYVYVAFGSCSSIVNECAGGLHVIDTTDPAAPQPILSGEPPLPFSTNLAASQQHLYVLTAQGLSVLNIINPDQPRIETYPPGQLVDDLSLVGDLLYLAAGEQGLQIFDLSTPGSPQLVSTWQPEVSSN